MNNEIPSEDWIKDLENTSIKQEELVVEAPANQDEIDPITGEAKPYECEGCSG